MHMVCIERGVSFLGQPPSSGERRAMFYSSCRMSRCRIRPPNQRQPRHSEKVGLCILSEDNMLFVIHMPFVCRIVGGESDCWAVMIFVWTSATSATWLTVGIWQLQLLKALLVTFPSAAIGELPFSRQVAPTIIGASDELMILYKTVKWEYCLKF